jgi:hypothetical protein
VSVGDGVFHGAEHDAFVDVFRVVDVGTVLGVRGITTGG